MKPKIPNFPHPALFAGLILVCLNSPSHAVGNSWIAGGTGSYTDPSKWTGGTNVPNGSSDVASSDGTGSTINFNSGDTVTLGTLNLNVSSGATIFNQTGGSLTLGTLGLANLTAGASRNPTYNLSGGTLDVTTSFAWGSGSNVRFIQSGGTVNYTGTNSIVMAPTTGGASTLTLSNNAEYKANSTLGLTLGVNTATATINLSNTSTFSANAATSVTFGSNNGIGNVNLADSSVFSVNTVTQLNVGNGGTAKGNITLSGSSRLNAAAATLVLGQFGTAGSQGTLTMSDTSSVTTANVVLGGNNAGSAVYGVINLNGGTLSTGSIRKGSSTIAASSTAQVLHADGGTIKATAHANNADFLAGTFVNLKAGGLKFDTNGNSVGISNSLSGVGSLTKQGAGTLTLAQKSTHAGGTIVDGGTLALGSGGNVGTIRGTLLINSGATVTTTVTDALGYDAGSSVGSIGINGGTLDNTTAGNQGFRTAISLTGGSLTSSGGGAFNFSGGFGLTSTASATTSTISAPITLRGASMDITVAQGTTGSGVDLAISGAIGQAIESGSYGITKKGSGTASLSGNNTYTGVTTVETGVLALGAGGSIANSSTIDVRAGAVLDASAGNGWGLATGQTLKGSGTVNVGAANTFNVSSGAILAPGNSPGTLNVTGSLAFADGSTFSVELQPDDVPLSDLINVSGDLTISSGAVLSIALFGSDALLADGTKFVLIDYSGTWTAGNGFVNAADDSYNNFGTLNTYLVDYNDSSLGGTALTLTVVPEPGHAMFAIVGALALILPRRRNQRTA